MSGPRTRRIACDAPLASRRSRMCSRRRRARAPGLGEHPIEILREHGFSAEDAERLRPAAVIGEAGAIGDAAAPPTRQPLLAADRP